MGEQRQKKQKAKEKNEQEEEKEKAEGGEKTRTWGTTRVRPAPC